MSTTRHPLLKAAKKIEPGAYLWPKEAGIKPKKAGIKPGEAVIVRGEKIAITDAESQYPVIGTEGLQACMCIFIRAQDKKHTTLVYHMGVPWDPLDLAALVRMVRGRRSRIPVSIHCIGALSYDDSGEAILDASAEESDYDKDMLEEFLRAVHAISNARLETWDVGTRPHPEGAAMDSRTGQLIRLSEDLTMQEHLYDPEYQPLSAVVTYGWKQLPSRPDDGPRLSWDGDHEAVRRRQMQVINMPLRGRVVYDRDSPLGRGAER